MRYREQAICLRTTDYSETSQVVHFITRETGVVHLLAKGTKRPKSKSQGAIDLFSEGELVFTSSGGEALGTLIEFTESTSHTKLRLDAGRLYTALYTIELVGATLAEGDPHPEVFDLLHNILLRLAKADAPIQAVLAYFQWRLLQQIGLLGDLLSCVECGRQMAADRPAVTRGAHFSSQRGGLLCSVCEGSFGEKFRVEPAAIAGLTALQAAQRGKAAGIKISLPDKQAHAVNRLLAYHVTQQLGRELKLARRHAIERPKPMDR